MDTDFEIKRQVREFYNTVGWKEASDGFYQNAVYEDLRPVAHNYVHRCHLRILRHLAPTGQYLLDAGSGPIQYPEYLEYSRGYTRRVCADISSLALQEARKRIGAHGLYVVCDIANLPFKNDVFDGMVSLHTIHHLPAEDHVRAYRELYRTLSVGHKGVVVNGWDNPPLTVFLNFWITLFERLYALLRPTQKPGGPPHKPAGAEAARGTFVRKHNAAWLKKEVGSLMPVSIWCWRSVSVRFLRTFIHPRWAGKALLKILFWKEELFPHLFGKYGQYPLIVITKAD